MRWSMHAPLPVMVAALACAAPGHEEEPGGACARQSALVSGQPHATHLGLGLASERAVVHVRVDDGHGAWLAPCSGVVVAGRWVLSAAHCARAASARAEVSVGPDARCPEGRYGSRRLHTHPRLDLLAIELERDLVEHAAAAPLATHDGAHGPRPGDVVTIAGFGRDNAGASGTREFVAVELAGVSDAWLDTRGAGTRGACAGDSGGPLLSRRAGDGAPVVLGVLSAGSLDCTGVDHYTPVAEARDWLVDLGVDARRGDAPCEAIDAVGRCFGPLAVRCEDGVLRASACASRCGYDAAAGHYACEAASACGEFDQVGRCEAGRAAWCDEGTLVAERCDDTELCRRDFASGRAGCVAADAPRFGD